MMDAEETKRNKAKQLRFRKPIAKNLNLDFIKQDLYDIQEACEEVHWYTDSDDGSGHVYKQREEKGEQRL